MGWAARFIDDLLQGKEVDFRPRGHSMTGKVNDGNLVHVVPVGDRKISKNDIVLCRVKGKEYLHLVLGVKHDEYQIGNNHGFVNGWTSKNQIFGIVTRVEP